jgi:DNA-binding MarR family transcriptional regulator
MSNHVLGPDSPYTFLFPAWIAHRSLHELLDIVLAPSGLSSDDLAIYSAVARMGDPRPGEVAGFLRLPPTTVSAHVRRLTTRGHVATERDPDDGRGKRLRLTGAGMSAHREALALFEPTVTALSAHMGEDRAHLDRGLSTLQSAIDHELGRRRSTSGRPARRVP